jgi:hypothetical protein
VHKLISLAVLICLAISTPALAQRSTPVQVLHPAGAALDQFGSAVAVDGDTMIVGAPSDDVGANTDQGSAHVYRWTGSGWTFEATLTATGGAANDFFGVSIALSGDTALVGASQDDLGANFDQGSAYIFTRSGTTWTQQAQLTATGGAAGDFFGFSVALSGDTALVGANLDNVGTNFDQGSAYIFVRSGTTWAQQAQLTATGGATNDQFGGSVALSGDTAIVGAQFDDVGANPDQGSAYIFTRSGATWTQQAQLNATGGTADDRFANAVALSGDTAIVGARLDDVGANANQGSAFVFVRPPGGTTWTQQAQLTAAGGAANDRFGIAVAIAGDTAIVGANLADIGANSSQGSASVFVRSGITWTQQAQLTASGGAVNDEFGVSVALSGDTAIVGANLDDVGANGDQGSAWVFSRIGSTWIIGPDFQALATGGALGDEFGVSVALSGDTAIVGAYGDDVGANADQGSAYVFTRSGSTWTQQAQLTASDGAASDNFGISVALSGDTAIVGAYDDTVGANAFQGSAYVFTRSGTTWTQQAKLFASDGASNDNFGFSVALSGNTAVVGAFGDNVGTNGDQGSAYVFTRSGTTWTQQAQLTAAGGAINDNFGWSVALSGNTAVVGARRDQVGANFGQGSAYVFTRAGTTWTQQAQLTASGGAVNDEFGYSVALSGDTAIVGANLDDVGANFDQGSAYVFTRSGITWTQQAQLTATGGAASDQFGGSVGLSGDTAIVGAQFDDVGANPEQGSAYVFKRSGSTWTQQAQLTATGGAANDFPFFGVSIALSGDTALVGALGDDVGANTNQGSAWFFDGPADGFSLARNDVTDMSYPTLAAALLPATSGQQITATEAAWRGIGSINTLGRSLAMLSSGELRTPSTSILDMGGSSFLAAAPGDGVEVFGQLRVSAGASVDVTGGSFRLGSRGILTARTNSSLTINAPAAALDGQTRLEQGASMTFASLVEAIGPVTANLNSSLTAGGIFTNIDTFTITVGTISTPLFYNRARANIFGTSAVFGSYTNEAGATTTIRSGTLFVFGSLTNNGTIIGTICSNCLGTPPNMDIGGDLNLGPAANLTMPFEGSTVRVGGHFNCAINSNTRYDMSLATLQFEGAGAEQTLEVMSRDIGADTIGLDRTITGHYPIGTLRIGPSPSTVRLVDTHDNDGLGQSACEAIYVDTLIIEAGSRLINTTCRIYYNTLVSNGTVDVPANLVPLTPPVSCDYDFNQDENVDLTDAQQMAQVFVGLLTPESNWLDGDLNGDENSDLTDAQILAAYVVTGNCGV